MKTSLRFHSEIILQEYTRYIPVIPESTGKVYTWIIPGIYQEKHFWGFQMILLLAQRSPIYSLIRIQISVAPNAPFDEAHVSKLEQNQIMQTRIRFRCCTFLARSAMSVHSNRRRDRDRRNHNGTTASRRR